MRRTFNKPSNIGGLIFFKQSKTIITGTSSADAIGNSMKGATIDAGDGSDTISLGNADESIVANNNVILYSEGEGTDFIRGFNETTTLRIDDGEGSYSTVESGNDIIVSDGSNKIILEGAASLSSVNISGTETPFWTLKNNTATYGSSKENG